jgi:P63C domain
MVRAGHGWRASSPCSSSTTSFPPHVLDELRRKNPVVHHGRRRHRHHQFLTKEIGNVHLDRHLPAVIALMRVATTWEDLERLMMKAFPARTMPDTLPLP